MLALMLGSTQAADPLFDALAQVVAASMSAHPPLCEPTDAQAYPWTYTEMAGMGLDCPDITPYREGIAEYTAALLWPETKAIERSLVPPRSPGLPAVIAIILMRGFCGLATRTNQAWRARKLCD